MTYSGLITPVQINSVPTPLMAWKSSGGSSFNDGIELENNSGLIALESTGFIQLE